MRLARHLLCLVGVTALLALAGCGEDAGVGAQPRPTADRPPASDGPEAGEAPPSPAERPDRTRRTNAVEPNRDLPRLVELVARVNRTYDQVILRFEGKGQVEQEIVASVREVDGPVRAPSGAPVDLAGEQALLVTIDPAAPGDVEPLRPRLPAVAEVRVLGAVQGQLPGQIVVAIGVNGSGELTPQVTNRGSAVVINVPRPPYPQTARPARSCGKVPLGSEHRATEIEAFRVGCATAQTVAAAVQGRIGQSYRARGFDCVPSRTTAALDSYRYICNRDRAKVTFRAR